MGSSLVDRGSQHRSQFWSLMEYKRLDGKEDREQYAENREAEEAGGCSQLGSA
jgi:hypothetical protein